MSEVFDKAVKKAGEVLSESKLRGLASLRETASEAAQKRWGFKKFDPIPGLPSGRGTFMPVGYTQTPTSEEYPTKSSIESEWAVPELLKDFLVLLEGAGGKPITPEEVFKGFVGPQGALYGTGLAGALKRGIDPTILHSFVGGVPKGAGKGTPASKETIDLLTKEYPHAAARGERYIVTERQPAKVGRYGSRSPQQVEIFPGTTPSVASRRPSDPSRGSMVYDPELGQIRKIEHIDTDTGVDLSLNIVEPKKQSLSLPDKKSDNIMYRGMSSEEFDQALKTGHFKSKGDYNVQGQDDLTYWSSRPSQAQNYASSFAPWSFKPTFERPAYVVGVKRKNVARVDADTELGVSGKTPVNDVVEIYKGDVHAITPGRHSIVDDWGTPRISGTNLESHVTWSKYDKGVTKNKGLSKLKEVERRPDFKGHAKDVYWTQDPITLKHVFNPDEDYAASIVATARHGPFETVDPVSPRILKSTKKQIYEATQKALENFPDKIKVYRMAEKDAPFNLEGVDSFTLDPKFSGSSLPWATERGSTGPIRERLKKNYKLTEYLVDKKDILAAPNALWKGSGVFDEQEVILRTAKLKGSGGLSSLGETRKIKAKPKHKSSDLVTHAASDSDLSSISKGGLRSGTHVEPAGDKIWSTGLHRLIYNKLPEDVGKLVSRKGMEDMPFYKLQQSIDADEIKMIEFPADDYPDILKETKRLKKLFGKTKVRPYWQDNNGKIFYSESAADKSQSIIEKKASKRAAEKIAYEESQMQPGFYVDRMTDQRPTLKYDPGQPDWEDLKRSTGGLVGLI